VRIHVRSGELAIFTGPVTAEAVAQGTVPIGERENF
jgi:hypothetical protein